MLEDQSDKVFGDTDEIINEVFELEDGEIEDDTENSLFEDNSDEDDYEADIPDGLLDEDKF